MTVHGSWTVDRLIDAYTHYQRRTRGLRPQTLRYRAWFARKFVRAALGADPIDPGRLTPAAVVAFITSLRHRFCPASMQTAQSSLRSFFRFLRVEGLCGDALEAALPTVAHWRLATLPRSLTEQQVEQVLASFDPSTPRGHRDRAIVQCLATLGLRPGEVADLCLDDIDWRAGTLQIRARKNRRGAVLPLPRVAGQALVAYLSRERPATDERRVFVVHQEDRRAPAAGRPPGATRVDAVFRALEGDLYPGGPAIDGCPVGSLRRRAPVRATVSIVGAPVRLGRQEGRFGAGVVRGHRLGSQKHQACVLDVGGKVLGEREFEHGGAGWHKWRTGYWRSRRATRPKSAWRSRRHAGQVAPAVR